jgi:hypothetical protein
LNAGYNVCLVKLKAALNQNFFCKRVANLHGWSTRRPLAVKSFRSENRNSTDAISAGASTEENYKIAGVRSDC